jgi:hypothetical protein
MVVPQTALRHRSRQGNTMIEFGDIELLVIMGGTQRVVNLVRYNRKLCIEMRA